MRDLGRAGRALRSIPVVVFAAVELFAFVMWLLIGRRGWFFLDEWDFLATRRGTDLGDLFRPHNEHWVTLPVIVYRVLYRLFGLRSYLPYRLVVVVLYLTAAALLLVVMRRAGINPWIATAAASAFALFGAGWQNIIEPFQITFTGSLVFGLASLLLADHDGPFDRRDWLAVLVGLLGLMTSAVAVVMVIVVGIAVLLRRGRRLALLYLAPLAACYVTWLLVIGRGGGSPRGQPGQHLTAEGTVSFVATGVRLTFRALGPDKRFSVPLTVVGLAALVVGLLVAARQRRRLGQLAQLAAPVALLAGTMVFLFLTAASRSGRGARYAGAPRLLSVVAATMLPALAVAADALTRHRRWLVPIAVGLFLVGIPKNVHTATIEQRSRDHLDAAVRQVLLTVPRDSLARQVPPSVTPETSSAWRVTIGWLLEAVERGQIPAPHTVTESDLASNAFRLSFYQQPGDAPTKNCRAVRQPIVLVLKKGDTIGVYNRSINLVPRAAFDLFPVLEFVPSSETRVMVLRDLGRVVVRPHASDDPWPRVCTGSA